MIDKEYEEAINEKSPEIPPAIESRLKRLEEKTEAVKRHPMDSRAAWLLLGVVIALVIALILNGFRRKPAQVKMQAPLPDEKSPDALPSAGFHTTMKTPLKDANETKV